MDALVIKKAEEGSAERVGMMLREGAVGALPCDTIYGLSGIVGKASADRLYEIKRRPQSKSFITLMTLCQLEGSSLEVPSELLGIWPAPLTAILRDRASGETVAVRVPDDDYIQRVMAISGPIYSTSVNFSGEKSLLSFEDILPVFSSMVDFIVSDPSIHGGTASTLIDATVRPFKVLRQGAYVI